MIHDHNLMPHIALINYTITHLREMRIYRQTVKKFVGGSSYERTMKSLTFASIWVIKRKTNWDWSNGSMTNVSGSICVPLCLEVDSNRSILSSDQTAWFFITWSDSNFTDKLL